jgi:hypothetical protein
MKLTHTVAAVALLILSAGASAQNCVGFVDVPASDAFCPNVEWLKNRSITLGCTDTTHYCPTGNVTRLAMAAFMNRLGSALTPTALYQDGAPGAITISTTGNEHCVTTAFPVAGYPRSVTLNGTFAVTAPGAVTFRAVTVYSTNGGATWTPTGANFVRSTSGAAEWSSSSSVGAVNLTVGQTYLFAVRVVNEAGSVQLADSRCQLQALIGNRNGTSTPFDQAAMSVAPR